MSRLSFEFLVNQEQVSDAIKTFEFIGGNSADAIRVAINKTTPRVRTRASALIREQVRLTASYVGDRLTIGKATRARLSGSIHTPVRGLLLSRFSTDSLIAGDKTSWIRPPFVPDRGIRVKVKPNDAPKVVKGDAQTQGKPFYVVLNGGQNVAIAARFKGERRKFKVFYGPSLSQVFTTVKNDILDEASNIYRDEIIDAVRYLTQKMTAPEAP